MDLNLRQLQAITLGALNIREEAGVKAKKVGTYNKGDVVTVYEQKKVGSQYWGRTDKGWVCMDNLK